MERLQKFIAESGICSRRKAEELIKNGHVIVNGKKITEMGYKVQAEDIIKVDNKIIKKDVKIYYLLNKPRGYICTLNDEFDRPIITSLVPQDIRVFPVGRLDYDTTGLIILTNDGKLDNILTKAANKVPKTYLAKVEGVITIPEIMNIKKGLVIDGRLTKPIRIKLKKTTATNSYVEITLIEGRNHIVKNIFHAINHEVVKLSRIKYGPLEIGTMAFGTYKVLTEEEIKALYKYERV